MIEDLSDPERFPELNLRGAEYLLFSGSSAGSSGMRQHLDAVAEHMTAIAPNLLAVRGIADSAYLVRPIPDDPCEAQIRCQIDHYNYWGAQLDSSCLTRYPEAPWSCMSTTLLIPELSTPFFVFMDQFDHLTLEGMGIYPEAGVFAEEQRSRMGDFQRLVLAGLTEEDGSFREGIYVPHRGLHTAISAHFHEPLIEGLSYQDVLLNWLRGEGVQSAVDQRPMQEADWDALLEFWREPSSSPDLPDFCACEVP